MRAFDDWVCALLRKKRDKWEVVEYAMGATDMVYSGSGEKHKAPCGIFE